MPVRKILYSKTMIDLIHGIRRRMPLELRAGVRFSSPHIFRNMAAYHNTTDDVIVKSMIRDLLSEVSDKWLSLLKDKNSEDDLFKPSANSRDGFYPDALRKKSSTTSNMPYTTDEPGKIIKVYRGHASIVDSGNGIDVATQSESSEQRIYRAQALAR